MDPSGQRTYTPAGRRPTDPWIFRYSPPPGSCHDVKSAATALLVAFVLAVPAQAQSPGAGDGVRIGVSFGGISTVALNVEIYRDSRALDLALGSWSFRDLSVSAVAKQYFGASSARPVVGAGLWMVTSWAGGERQGVAVVLRAPVGVDWAINDSRHSAGAFLNVNRGLWVRRSDPRHQLPMNRRFVPLPEVYYRFQY